MTMDNNNLNSLTEYERIFLQIENICEEFSVLLLPNNENMISVFYNSMKPLIEICGKCCDKNLCEKVKNIPNFIYIMGIAAYYLGDISEIEKVEDQLKYEKMKLFYLDWTEYKFTKESGYELIEISNNFNAYCFLGNYYE